VKKCNGWKWIEEDDKILNDIGIEMQSSSRGSKSPKGNDYNISSSLLYPLFRDCLYRQFG
jgi:CCR4-NOT transcriptional regulation complex NOT5 subunit